MPEIHREYRDRLFCYIFGSEAHKDWTLSLSDAFAEDVRDEADISVRVRMININKGHSAGVVNSCKPLNEYTWLVDRVRTYGSQMPLEAAVDRTLREMPEDYLIKPWLEANREGVKRMLLTEYDEAKTKLSEVDVLVQVLGKPKAHVMMPAEADNDTMTKLALENSDVQAAIAGKTVAKVICVKGRLVNIVAK